MKVEQIIGRWAYACNYRRMRYLWGYDGKKVRIFVYQKGAIAPCHMNLIACEQLPKPVLREFLLWRMTL